jgi:hypothetical protein
MAQGRTFVITSCAEFSSRFTVVVIAALFFSDSWSSFASKEEGALAFAIAAVGDIQERHFGIALSDCMVGLG